MTNMSDGTLASAVALPDQDDIRQFPEATAKRRKSSLTEHDPKRRRLSIEGSVSPHEQRQRLSQSAAGGHEPERPKPTPNERIPAQRGGREDERKRGQRLFGGLLGTLSQSSSSAAQKRRADIEKRQQDKLKNQADEYDNVKSQKKERRDSIRKKEMPFYERETMQTRHSNLVATAHFLKTRTEPVLYYKPWQLRARDETTIAEQIKEAEANVSREISEFEARYPPEAFVRQPDPELKNEQPAEQQPSPVDTTPQEKNETRAEHPTTTEHEATTNEPSESMADAQNTQSSSDPSNTNEADAPNETAQAEAHRAADDDGGEVVEDNEDTVIY